MKKNFFLAALAGVALVGCAKNEVAQVTDDSQREITFSTPVLALNTKANIVDGATFPDDETFKVFAYYSEGEFSSTNTTVKLYMDNVEVVKGTYDNSTEGQYGWHATPAYYWPKNTNSMLTFDAYFPNSLGFTSSADAGLKLTDYNAPNDVSSQNDILYANRAYNKKYSTDQTNDSNATYDGVDIKFNHAMSAVRIIVKAKDDAAANAIKVKSIALHSISLKGSFSQELSSNWTSVTNSKWTIDYSSPLQDYYPKNKATDFAGSTLITLADTQYGDDMIVLPQVFNSSNSTIEIVYYLQNGGASGPYVEQKYSFDLKSTDHKISGGDQISQWEMGKRYIYTITFDVNEIFLAPSLTPWTDVNVTVPTI